MRIEKHLESLKEVLDEINTSTQDPRGILKHQRRLAFMLALGVSTLIEIYFHKLGIMKSGSAIKHEWFKKSVIRDILSNQIIKSINSVRKIDELIEIAEQMEEKRNMLAYGSSVDVEDILMGMTNKFLDMKKIIEKEIGDLNV